MDVDKVQNLIAESAAPDSLKMLLREMTKVRRLLPAPVRPTLLLTNANGLAILR